MPTVDCDKNFYEVRRAHQPRSSLFIFMTEDDWLISGFRKRRRYCQHVDESLSAGRTDIRPVSRIIRATNTTMIFIDATYWRRQGFKSGLISFRHLMAFYTLIIYDAILGKSSSWNYCISLIPVQYHISLSHLLGYHYLEKEDWLLDDFFWALWFIIIFVKATVPWYILKMHGTVISCTNSSHNGHFSLST